MGLPPIPLVPISSTQAIVGAILGIGLYKGMRNINLKVLGSIASGWITTPVAGGLLSFFLLFFVKNLFGIDVGHSVRPVTAGITEVNNIGMIIRYIIIFLLIITAVSLVYMILSEREKAKKLNSGKALR
jgi:phosphate/sulfate permease